MRADPKKLPRHAMIGVGLALGTSFGIVFGAVYGNVGVGVAFGTSFGLIIGVCIDAQVGKRAEADKNGPDPGN